ncbi:MAG: division/cell wall cluster transcriptional repressor MraZ [Syntrophaceae bacterium]|nr:division/cell wall cluster transcriptional repressor MraZ [Syntrophaceae bacterium]
MEEIPEMSVFRGTSYHTIDDKGRVIFPSRFREVFNERQDNRLFITNLENYLVVFPHDEWVVIEKMLSQQPTLKKPVRDFRRFFMSAAADCTLDSQGRILIPPNLREFAQLEKDIVLVAWGGKNFEIWNKDRFEAQRKQTVENFDSHLDSLPDDIANLVLG